MSKSIVDLAQEMSDCFEWKERLDGTPYVILSEEKRKPWMVDIVRNIHGDKLPDDTTYRFIESACDSIADMDSELSLDDIQDNLYSCIEPDIYTSDLTAWLNDSNDHVYYLTEVLEELDIKDGFQLLGAAQEKQKLEIAQSLLSELNREVSSNVHD